MPKVRVIHIGLGPIGLEIATLVAARPDLESVAAFDVDPALSGRNLGELIGADSAGAVEVETPGPMAGTGELVLHSTGSSLREVAPQLFACIDAGLTVVSTCEELSYPWRSQPELARDLDRAAADAGVAVLGTGVNPGFAMDFLPLVLSGAVASVERVQVHRVQDAARRRLPLQRKVGAGLGVAEFEERVAAGTVGHVGLVESAHALAAALSLDLGEVSETIEPVVAGSRLTSGLGEIAAGLVAGIRQTARGITPEGFEAVTLVLEMAVGLSDSRDEVSISGSPGLQMVIPGGLSGDSATAAVVVNSIRALSTAAPGLRTMADLPPPHP